MCGGGKGQREREKRTLGKIEGEEQGKGDSVWT